MAIQKGAKMKKISILIIAIFLFSGCTLISTTASVAGATASVAASAVSGAVSLVTP